MLVSMVGIFTTIPFYVNDQAYKVDAALYINLASFLTCLLFLVSYGYSWQDRVTCCNLKLFSTIIAFMFAIAFMVAIFIASLNQTSSESSGLVLLFTIIINFSLYVFRAIIGVVVYFSRKNAKADLSNLY